MDHLHITLSNPKKESPKILRDPPSHCHWTMQYPGIADFLELTGMTDVCIHYYRNSVGILSYSISDP